MTPRHRAIQFLLGLVGVACGISLIGLGLGWRAAFGFFVLLTSLALIRDATR